MMSGIRLLRLSIGFTNQAGRIIPGLGMVLALGGTLILVAALTGGDSSRLGSVPAAFAAGGSIWTTDGGCGAEGSPQDVNSYNVGDHVYINGAGFGANEAFTWTITGQPGNASSKPNIVVASGSGTADAGGALCFDAHTVQSDEWGVFTADLNGKNDNYNVAPPTPTATATSTVTQTPTNTATATNTSTATNTATATITSTATNTPTATITSTVTNTPAITNTPTNTPVTPTDTPITIIVLTNTPIPSSTSLPTATGTTPASAQVQGVQQQQPVAQVGGAVSSLPRSGSYVGHGVRYELVGLGALMITAGLGLLSASALRRRTP